MVHHIWPHAGELLPFARRRLRGGARANGLRHGPADADHNGVVPANIGVRIRLDLIINPQALLPVAVWSSDIRTRIFVVSKNKPAVKSSFADHSSMLIQVLHLTHTHTHTPKTVVSGLTSEI